jgi:hypothetical protein
MSDETFKKHWFLDRVTSSAGYSITLRRDCIRFRDELGAISIDAEWAPGKRISVIAYSSSLPDGEGRRRQEILGDLERAFAAAGWQLTVRA